MDQRAFSGSRGGVQEYEALGNQQGQDRADFTIAAKEKRRVLF
jgi:hypothetical protein